MFVGAGTEDGRFALRTRMARQHIGFNKLHSVAEVRFTIDVRNRSRYVKITHRYSLPVYELRNKAKEKIMPYGASCASCSCWYECVSFAIYYTRLFKEFGDFILFEVVQVDEQIRLVDFRRFV